MSDIKGNVLDINNNFIKDCKLRYGVDVTGDKNNIFLKGYNSNNLNIVKGMTEKELFYKKNKNVKLNNTSKPGSVSSQMHSIF